MNTGKLQPKCICGWKMCTSGHVDDIKEINDECRHQVKVLHISWFHLSMSCACHPPPCNWWQPLFMFPLLAIDITLLKLVQTALWVPLWAGGDKARLGILVLVHISHVGIRGDSIQAMVVPNFNGIKIFIFVLMHLILILGLVVVAHHFDLATLWCNMAEAVGESHWELYNGFISAKIRVDKPSQGLLCDKPYSRQPPFSLLQRILIYICMRQHPQKYLN